MILPIIRALAGGSISPASAASPAQGSDHVSFGKALIDALGGAGKAERSADEASQRFAAGDPNVGIHEVMIAAEKASISVRYAQLIYDGLWFSELRQALAAFVEHTEKDVIGEVRVRLYKGRAEAVGRRSPRSLYRQDLATFGEGMAYDHKDAEGFIRLLGLPERVRALTRLAAAAPAARPEEVKQ